MKIKVSEATELQLDWMVAKALGYRVAITDYGDGEEEVFFECPLRDEKDEVIFGRGVRWKPTTNPDQAWPIIDRDGIASARLSDGTWRAWYSKAQLGIENYYRYFSHIGPTSLVAAMRCFVASKLGDEVDVPEELV